MTAKIRIHMSNPPGKRVTQVFLLTLLFVLQPISAFADIVQRRVSNDGRFVKLPQLLTYGRSGHNVELLNDGRVLVAGGAWGDFGGENSSEVLKISDQRVRFAGQKMSTLRSAATHAKLSDGRILFMGGSTDFETAISTTDIFDPTTNTFTPGSEMMKERSGHASVALPDGRILVFGGTDSNEPQDSVEIYDPLQGSFRLLDARLEIPRANHTATLVNEHTVAIVGGETTPSESERESAAPFLGSIELFDVPSLQFSNVKLKMTAPRIYHTATRLDARRVLIAGGLSDFVKGSNVVEVLDVVERSIARVGYTLRARSMHSLSLLQDGTFLVAGGVENGVPLADSERCSFITADDVNCLSAAKMQRARWGHTATPLSQGSLLFIGGLTNTPEIPGRSSGPMRGMEIYKP